MKLFYRRHADREMIPYDVPAGAPIPRVGEFVTIRREGRTDHAGRPLVESFKVARVSYLHGVHTDDPVHVDVELTPVTGDD